MDIASEANLDLVEVAEQANPPVCKLMDYGKFKYDADRREKEQKKQNAGAGKLKELQFKLNIEDHDYNTKLKNARKFLSKNNKVKVVVKLIGREQGKPELAATLLQRFSDDTQDIGQVETPPSRAGRNISMVIAPKSD